MKKQLNLKNYFFNSLGVNKKKIFTKRVISLYPSGLGLHRNLYFSQNKSFCNLARLNLEKLKLDDINASSQLGEDDILKEEKPFVKEENILEYGPGTDWEKEVLQSEVPVVVDCYAV